MVGDERHSGMGGLLTFFFSGQTDGYLRRVGIIVMMATNLPGTTSSKVWMVLAHAPGKSIVNESS